jgi:antitoxin (DNA-binding transcriptional repressor) of toxin-antitoxin stability system
MYMKTHIVGVKEFRNNMASLTRRAQRNGSTLLVLNNNKPFFNVSPVSPRQVWEAEMLQAAERGIEDLKHGRTIGTAEMLRRISV